MRAEPGGAAWSARAERPPCRAEPSLPGRLRVGPWLPVMAASVGPGGRLAPPESRPVSVPRVPPSPELAAREALTALSPLGPADWGAVAARLRVRRVSAGGFLLRQGDVCDYLGVLTAGALRTCNVTFDGEERTGWLTVSGMVSTEVLSFYSREPSLEFVEAVADAELAYLTHADLEALCAARPAVERLARRVAEHVLADLKGHLLSHLHDPAPERYARLLRVRPRFVDEVPLKHVASFLGVDPSTLSRIRALGRSDGAAQRSGRRLT